MPRFVRWDARFVLCDHPLAWPAGTDAEVRSGSVDAVLIWWKWSWMPPGMASGSSQAGQSTAQI
jgi:hypothetical protein